MKTVTYSHTEFDIMVKAESIEPGDTIDVEYTKTGHVTQMVLISHSKDKVELSYENGVREVFSPESLTCKDKSKKMSIIGLSDVEIRIKKLVN